MTSTLRISFNKSQAVVYIIASYHTHNFIRKSRDINECVILSDKLFKYIKICQKKASLCCMRYIIFWCLMSGVVIVYARIQFIIPIMPYLRHRQAKNVYKLTEDEFFLFSKAYEIRDFNHIQYEKCS